MMNYTLKTPKCAVTIHIDIFNIVMVERCLMVPFISEKFYTGEVQNARNRRQGGTNEEYNEL